MTLTSGRQPCIGFQKPLKNYHLFQIYFQDFSGGLVTPLKLIFMWKGQNEDCYLLSHYCAHHRHRVRWYSNSARTLRCWKLRPFRRFRQFRSFWRLQRRLLRRVWRFRQRSIWRIWKGNIQLSSSFKKSSRSLSPVRRDPTTLDIFQSDALKRKFVQILIWKKYF